MNKSKKLKVFMSYAHEDFDAIQELSRNLENEGFDIWLDNKKLIAGQHWRNEIEKALYSSDAVVFCLSS